MRLIDEIHQYLSRHVVSLIWIDRASGVAGSERTLCLSGTLVSVAGRSFLVTAGHVVEALDKVLQQGRELVHCELYGNWSDANTEHGKIAFGYKHARRLWSYNEDEGVDYGLIHLTDYYVSHLAAIGMRPLSEANWLHRPPIVKNHVLIGMPSEFVRTEAGNPQTDFRGTTTLANVLLPLIPTDSPPPELVKPHRRFYGKIAVSHIAGADGSRPLSDIDGMSGGPVLAAGQWDSGVVDCWLEGIQSGWHRPSRVIAASPADVFFARMREQFSEIDSL